MSYYFITPYEARKQRFLNLFRRDKIAILPNEPWAYLPHNTGSMDDDEYRKARAQYEVMTTALIHGRSWLKEAK